MSHLLAKLRSTSKRSLILAIESSCDDTCLAILDEKSKIIQELKCSQKKLHQPFGGIVPRLAAHGHRTSFSNFLQNELLQYVIKNNYIKLIAVTAGPGIGNCLNSGFEIATFLSRSHGIPLIPTNHLLGHLFSVDYIADINFPRLSLIVSGGNTQLVFSRSAKQHFILGLTIDDALGEAIDKSARLLNCKWSESGSLGVELEKLASNGRPFQLNTRSLKNYKDPLSFSFSGLKTALKLFIEEKNSDKLNIEDLAATIQELLFGHVIDRVKNCLEIMKTSEAGIKTLSLIGGVASNVYLRNRLSDICSKYGIQLVSPPTSLCTDNAVMIGIAANKIVSSSVEQTPKLQRINTEWNLEELSINKSFLD